MNTVLNSLPVNQRVRTPWRPRVSVLIPCRNEGDFIGKCLTSIIHGGYPLDLLEIIVVDGVSTDATRAIVASFAEKYPFVRILDNLKLHTPHALNIGIAAATGEVIIRMDAHATYDPGYISYCLDAMERFGAEDVGGVWNIIPRTSGIAGRVIARALAHKFGGAAKYRTCSGTEPEFVDLIPFFCCRRETLQKTGDFNLKLMRHQDFEYNVRLRNNGVRFMLAPRAVCNYFARTDLKSFVSHSYKDGLWVILASSYTDVLPLAVRHVIPLLFVGAVVILGFAGAFVPVALEIWAAMLATYLVADVVASMQIAIAERSILALPVAAAIFPLRHFAFGCGSLAGALRILCSARLWTRSRAAAA